MFNFSLGAGMIVLRPAVIALMQFALTAGAIVGGMIIAANATRAGLDTWPISGELLRGAALVLAWPTRLLLRYLEQGSPWFWTLVALNSVLWAVVIEVGWRSYRARRNSSVT
jgi:hypothetical protein